MVWGRVYSQTKDIWQEGEIVLVEGKVRERSDQMQLICDRVSRYDLEGAPAMVNPVGTAANGHSAGNGATRVANGQSKAPNGKEAPPNGVTARACRRMVITLQQSADPDGDVARLHRLMDLLRQYPGEDEVELLVGNGVKVFKLKMGQTRVSCSAELLRLARDVVGEDSVKLEEG
jgi:DNA polymerase-3 subunit alpha